MEKLKMHSPNFTDGNLAKIRELFPNCVTEAKHDDGKTRYAVDFDQLRQELSYSIVDGAKERYQLSWPGKHNALLTANAPIAKTLRPDREASLRFETTDNLFIEGDNLEALKLLQETYLGKVKMIYIDPPYNTGNDFIYDDSFAEARDKFLLRSSQKDEDGNRLVANKETAGRFHSNWLSMMYPRIKLARNLLSDDGVIFISIDDNESHNLRRLCAEIFGEENFVATIIWQKVFAPKNTARWFSEDHDYVLIFAKNKTLWEPIALPQTEEMIARYKNPDSDSRGVWQSDNLTARNRYDAGLYSVTCPSGRVIDGPPTGTYWRVSKEKFDSLDSDNRIWWGDGGNNMPRLKRFLSEVKQGRTPQTFWPWKEVGHTQDAKKTLMRYVQFQYTENVLNSVKPVELIQRMLHLATSPNEDCIVLDFFGGSATTAHAVLKQNREDGGKRRFITIQLAEPLPTPELKMATIFDMGVERIRNVVAELDEEGGIEVGPGFRVLKIDSSNMADVYYTPSEIVQEDLLGSVNSIKPDRNNAEDLLFQVLVDWGVDLALPIRSEAVQGKTVYFVNEAPYDLMACFDTGITEELVKELAKHEPLRMVFRDSGFASDAVKINVDQIFRQLSPATEVKAI